MKTNERLHQAALLGALLLPLTALAGPYAPAAGQPGSTAVDMNDAAIIDWASGYQDYLPGARVDAVWQTPDKALGPAQGTSFDIVSLGAGGRITLLFDTPIANGAGADFAVFENSINDTFLELATVEVSSDGVNFFAFPGVSLTPSPVGSFGAVDATDIDGLAGKYRQGFGTPFDLADLSGIAGLDISAVSHVRLIDVIGDGSRQDSQGHPIYDPTPTFGSAGFDLDAVAVLNNVSSVPLPGAFWLMASAVAVLFGIRKKS